MAPTEMRRGRKIGSSKAVTPENLNPDILMMQPTKNWDGCDGAELLDAPEIRRVLVQREVGLALATLPSVPAAPSTSCGRSK
jgi:hypothetical protein